MNILKSTEDRDSYAARMKTASYLPFIEDELCAHFAGCNAALLKVSGVPAGYHALMGSHAFGTANEQSDCDVYGFCLPSAKSSANAEVEAFAKLDFAMPGALPAGLYDFKLYLLPDFFQRCLVGKSQVLETLYVSEENILHMTASGKLLRENRNLFLHQGTVTEFLRFAWVQFEDMVHLRRRDGKRLQYIQEFGFDLKAAYHVVRLLNEAEQLLLEGTLDLRRSALLLQDIRKGVWSKTEVMEYCQEKRKHLLGFVAAGVNVLPPQPDKQALANLLEHCLQMEGNGVI